MDKKITAMDLESDALKVKEDSESTDEPERGTWSGRFDFLLSLLGYSVGLGNVWRFPYLAYNNGGGAFLVPFAIMLVLAGLPLMFMELAFGQYAALGPVAVYNQFSPLFQGLGYGMVIVSTIVMLYYNLIIAWTIWYIVASAARVLPWHTCDPKWSTKYCYSYEKADECLSQNQSYYLGLCHNLTEGIIPGLELQERRPPAEEYFTNRVLGLSSGIEETGTVRWEMALCLLTAWVIVFLCLCKGVHSSGKVVYFTALFPYVVLVVLFVRGVTLPGAGTGILYYLTPDWSRLANAQVWGDAAVQIFFALSPAWGGLITLSSYNKFSNNCYIDSLIVAASNIGTSFFAGLVIFAVIGFLAHELHVDVDKVVDQGAGLAFIVYPEVVTRLPIAPLWSLLFFIMLLTLGLDSQFALMETVTTAILDGFPSLRSRKVWVVFGVAVFGYLGGLIFTTNSGMYWLQLMDKYAANWSVLMLAIGECVLIAWVYGTERFCADIQLMIGKQSRLWVLFWSFMWKFTTPTALIFILVFNWVEYRPAQYGTYIYPAWADAVGWTLGLLPVLVVLLVAVAQICNGPDDLTVMETARMLSQPTREWGAGDAKAMGMTSTTGTGGTTGTTGTTSSTAVLLMRGRATPREHQPCMLLPRGSITRRASQDSTTSHDSKKFSTGMHKPIRHGRRSLVQSLSQDSSDPTIEPLLKDDDHFPGIKEKCAKLQSTKIEEGKIYNDHSRDIIYTKLSTTSTPVKNIQTSAGSNNYTKLESNLDLSQTKGNYPTSIMNKRRESATKKKIDFAHPTQSYIEMTTFSKSKESEAPEDALVFDTSSDNLPLLNKHSIIFTTAKIHENSKNMCPMPSQVVVIPIASSFENKSYEPYGITSLSTFGSEKYFVDKNNEKEVPRSSIYNSKTVSNQKNTNEMNHESSSLVADVSNNLVTLIINSKPIIKPEVNAVFAETNHLVTPKSKTISASLVDVKTHVNDNVVTTQNSMLNELSINSTGSADNFKDASLSNIAKSVTTDPAESNKTKQTDTKQPKQEFNLAAINSSNKATQGTTAAANLSNLKPVSKSDKLLETKTPVTTTSVAATSGKTFSSNKEKPTTKTIKISENRSLLTSKPVTTLTDNSINTKSSIIKPVVTYSDINSQVKSSTNAKPTKVSTSLANVNPFNDYPKLACSPAANLVEAKSNNRNSETPSSVILGKVKTSTNTKPITTVVKTTSGETVNLENITAANLVEEKSTKK